MDAPDFHSEKTNIVDAKKSSIMAFVKTAPQHTRGYIEKFAIERLDKKINAIDSSEGETVSALIAFSSIDVEDILRNTVTFVSIEEAKFLIRKESEKPDPKMHEIIMRLREHVNNGLDHIPLQDLRGHILQTHSAITEQIRSGTAAGPVFSLCDGMDLSVSDDYLQL